MRPNEKDRTRSIRIPCTEEEFRLAHELAGLIPISVYVRDLLMREAAAKGLTKTTKKGSKR